MSLRAGKKAKFSLFPVAAEAFSGYHEEICPKEAKRLKIKNFQPI